MHFAKHAKIIQELVYHVKILNIESYQVVNVKLGTVIIKDSVWKFQI